jgi:hypothetical protein
MINVNLKNNFIVPSLLRYNFTKNSDLNQKIITPSEQKLLQRAAEVAC